MARLDTGWHAHPKILALGLDGMGLHAWSISYSDDTLSDGFIPAGAWPALPGVKKAVNTLLNAGLWERRPGGFQVHDYLAYNRAKTAILADRANKIAAGVAGGQASAQARAQAESKQTGKQTVKQKPTPVPGPVKDLLETAAAAAVTQVQTSAGSTPARARTHEAPALSPELQAEHEGYLARERAAAAAASENSLNGRRRA